MYIDFSKFNYDLIPKNEREEYIRRDKAAYSDILKKWIAMNSHQIIERKWEIKDIAYIKETSDFIKLLKEAETLYELGFYTSCIALICVCAEDFTKYLALKLSEHDLSEESQFKRLKTLVKIGCITPDIYSLLDDIRKTRNNCLHYDMDFKKKDDLQLKQEALTVLNQFKNVVELTLGFDGDISMDEFTQLICEATEQLSTESLYIKGLDDMSFRVRNAMSRLFNLDLTLKPGVKDVVTSCTYKVLDLDYDEHSDITILDLANDMPVVVDLDNETKEMLVALDIKAGDLITAKISSEISSLGLTGIWKFTELQKA